MIYTNIRQSKLRYIGKLSAYQIFWELLALAYLMQWRSLWRTKVQIQIAFGSCFLLQPIIMAFEKQIVGFFFLFVFRGVECHMSQFQWRHLFFANHFFELDYGLDVPMVNRMGFFKNENKLNLAEYISIEYQTVVDWNIKVHMSYDIRTIFQSIVKQIAIKMLI